MSKAYRDEGLSNKKPSVDHEIIREGAKDEPNEFESKILDPEYKYLTDWEDSKNIHHHNGWYEFVAPIVEAVRNRGLNKYPFALSNRVDNSVSFFVSTEIESTNPFGPYYNRDFISSIEKGYFVEQIEFQLREMGFETVGKKDVLEVREGDSVICKI